MLLNYQQKNISLNKSPVKCEPIILIHGLFGSLSNLAGLAKELQKKHPVISVDLRNHGNSPHAESMSYLEMASDIFELADHLDIEDFSLVGHSMGGKVAMRCALLKPQRINKVVIADIAPVAYTDQHRDVFNGLQALMNQPVKDRKSADLLLSEYIKTAEVRQFLLKSLLKRGEEYQLQFNLAAIMDNYDAIRGWSTVDHIFNKEILFIKGADSDYILPEKQADILRLFPKAKAKIIANTGHWLHVEKPKTFNRLVAQFFN